MKKGFLINLLIIVFVISGLFTLNGCSSSRKITMHPESNLLHKSKKVKVDVYSIGAQNTVDPSVISRLSDSIKYKLNKAGFVVTEDINSIRLKVNVKKFDDGNQALRILITLGPGGASLDYWAVYFDQNGDILADVYDKVHLSGWDPHIDHYKDYSGGTAIFGSAEAVTSDIIKIAAQRIVNIALNDYQ